MHAHVYVRYGYVFMKNGKKSVCVCNNIYRCTDPCKGFWSMKCIFEFFLMTIILGANSYVLGFEVP